MARKRRAAARDDEPRGPAVGSVVAITWIDSGTRSSVANRAEALDVRCHEATCYGEVAYVDDDRIVVYTERYDDGSGTAEAIAQSCVVSLDVLRDA